MNGGFRDYFDAGLDQRDTDRIDVCNTRQGEIYATYRRAADEHDIDPEPVPHIHDDHEEKARRCGITTWLAHGVGALVVLSWSYANSDHSMLVSLGAVLLYCTLAMIAVVSILACAPRAAFCLNFWMWFLPMVPVCLISASILLAERFASPDWADFLLKFDTAAWLGLEFSMLILGSVSMVGQRRFGWSGVLTREFRALENEITELRRKIAARRRTVGTPQPESDETSQRKQAGQRSGPADIAMLVFAALFGMTPAIADACPAVLPDQTGSVAEQELKEERLSAALATSIAMLPGSPCLDVMPFSANPFSAAVREVGFTAHKPAVFTPIRKALEAQLRTEALNKIRSSLRPRLPIATCSNISDAMIVAASATDNALIYTDGKHDCAAPPRQGITSNHAVIVVLVRSLNDGDSDAETFSKRRAVMLKIMPKAIVLPEFELDRAVRFLLQTDQTPSLIYATF